MHARARIYIYIYIYIYIHSPTIRLEALTKTNNDVRSSGRDSNRAPPEYNLEPRQLQPVYSVCIVAFV
jgi:hypothetical protein